MVRIQEENRLIFGSKTLTWVELQAQAEAALGSPVRFADNRFVAVVDGMESALAALVYGVAHRLDWGVIEATRLSPEVEERFYSSGLALADFATGSKRVADSALTGFVPGRITVLTSGTTGLLKLIPHTDKTLNTFDRVRELHPNRWFLPYQIGSYAWYQMAMLGLFVAGQDLIPGDFSDLAGSFASALQSHQITAISSTPTFWRHALMMTEENLLATAPLQSISLGGEIVDQAILDRLASLYPAAAIRHIYASSEAGAAIIVSDGCAGFPKSLLQQEDGAVAIKVDDGRLFIRSRYGNSGAGGSWIDTGDLVEIRNDRVQFCGRADNSMINVGGQKAFPADIEAHLLTHPEVVWVKVSARRAPLVGFLPVAAVVLREPHDPIAAETILRRHCESRLAEFAVPRIWSFLETVPMQASLKS
jgi:acyl-coenzyme A synthetase/AMP-(fatty) acid ligase